MSIQAAVLKGFFVTLLGLNLAYAHIQVPIYVGNEGMTDRGFDVYEGQSVAVRFSPTEDVQLDKLELWFGSNNPNPTTVTISVRNDVATLDGSMPGDMILEQWTMEVVHSNSIKRELHSKAMPQLYHSERYWIVAESTAKSLQNPIWSTAQSEGIGLANGYYGRKDLRIMLGL